MAQRIPELLSPAGSLEKLKTAILYGADAVYLSFQKFGLRSRASNFSYDEIRSGVEFARKRKAKVYVTINAFLHDKEIQQLPQFISFLEEVKVNAVIVSDLGALTFVKKYSKNLPIHLSTQASCLNVESALMWKQMGVKRVTLGREVSIEDAIKIKRMADIEVEMFVHGSMCMAYSGNCVISNYTFGRDSNRGGCKHSCRFKYQLEKNDFLKKANFLSSKDLCGFDLLPNFIKAGIDSLKIEGRMKGPHYLGIVTKSYAQALKILTENKNLSIEESKKIEHWKLELNKVSHRDYFSGNLLTKASAEGLFNQDGKRQSRYVVVGVVMAVKALKYILIEVRHTFSKGDIVEIVPFKSPVIKIRLDWICDLVGEEYQKTNPGTLVKIPFIEGVEKLNIIRRSLI